MILVLWFNILYTIVCVTLTLVLWFFRRACTNPKAAACSTLILDRSLEREAIHLITGDSQGKCAEGKTLLVMTLTTLYITTLTSNYMCNDSCILDLLVYVYNCA